MHDAIFCSYCGKAFSAEKTITTFYALNASELSFLTYRTKPVSPISSLMPIEEFIIEEHILKKYRGHDKDFEIPYGVISIGIEAFDECSSLTSII